MSKPRFYATQEGRAYMVQFILNHQHSHTVDMIHEETGASRDFIKNVFFELDIEPLLVTDVYMKFLLDNPEMSPGEYAKALGVTTTYIFILLSKKPSARLKQIMKQQKQIA